MGRSAGESAEQVAGLRRADFLQDFHGADQANFIDVQSVLVQAIQEYLEAALGFKAGLGPLGLVEGRTGEATKPGEVAALVVLLDPDVANLSLSKSAIRRSISPGLAVTP